MMVSVEEEEDENSTYMSDGSQSSASFSKRSDAAPMGSDIQDAIDRGDWAAVGSTAAILANDPTNQTDNVSYLGGPSFNSGDSAAISEADTFDAARAAEIDQLVETGNWDGVVAVAARYADDASLQSGKTPRSDHGSVSRGRKPWSQNSDDGSIESASIETADASSVRSSSVESQTTRSRTTYSGSASQSEMDETHDDDGTLMSEDQTNVVSSVSSSFASRNQTTITRSMDSSTSASDNAEEKTRMNAYRAEVEALVRRVVPDEIDNIDDIMVQFSGREQELIETLRAMQEKSIAQRARAAVQRSAKKEASRTGSRAIVDDSSEDPSSARDNDTVSAASSHRRSASTNDGNSITEEFADDSSYSTSSSGSGSYSTRSQSEYSDSQGVTRSDYSQSQYSQSEYSESQYSQSQDDSGGSMGVLTVEKSEDGVTKVKTSPGLTQAIDDSDWKAVQSAAAKLDGGNQSAVSSQRSGISSGMSRDSRDEMDDMIDSGNWSGIIDQASNMAAGGHESD
jgi:hypothetical protein